MEYLTLGGPAHGTYREHNGENETIIMAPSPGNPLPSPWTYVLREIQAETRPGVFFKRDVLVEKSMPVEVATQALAAVLMQSFAEQLVIQFMEGGEQVGTREAESSTSSGKSGLLIAQR